MFQLSKVAFWVRLLSAIHILGRRHQAALIANFQGKNLSAGHTRLKMTHSKDFGICLDDPILRILVGCQAFPRKARVSEVTMSPFYILLVLDF